nr:unnamed protein product [Spirometra erinaceieuropaei]
MYIYINCEVRYAYREIARESLTFVIDASSESVAPHLLQPRLVTTAASCFHPLIHLLLISLLLFILDLSLAVYGPPTKGTAPLLSADGSTLLTERTQILQRWAEHFRGVLNRPSAISDAAIERLPQVETNADLDLLPSLQETIRAVQQLSSGKAPGSDAIPAEVYKHGGPQLMDR